MYIAKSQIMVGDFETYCLATDRSNRPKKNKIGKI